jgi:MoaA/NifB/PqqE/SkfB family radical SAM enzyme
MLKQLARLPGYNLARMTNRFVPLPMNITFSVSYKCNSRCKTCNVWKKRVNDLTLDEYEQIFRKLGHTPYWLTFSGGEPFLRPDLIDVVLAAYRHCRPGIINIPTNGILVDRIVPGVERLAREAPESQVVINLSLDGVGTDHDELRGVKGNYELLRESYDGLRTISAPNLTVGIHSVISQHNVDGFIPLRQHVRDEIKPDSFITEIAEERVELDTIGLDITPSATKYNAIVDQLIADIDENEADGVAAIAQSFRRHYYQIAQQTLREQRQVLPCYAGVSSAHIAPNGDVWTCCIRAEPIGSLREHGYDLRPIWSGTRAGELRESIKRGDCHCPLANAAYSSMLYHPPSLAKVGLHFAARKVAKLAGRGKAARLRRQEGIS